MIATNHWFNLNETGSNKKIVFSILSSKYTMIIKVILVRVPFFGHELVQNSLHGMAESYFILETW